MTTTPRIDVVQALELLEICAAEMANEHRADAGGPSPARGARLSIAARALAKRELTTASLRRGPISRCPRGAVRSDGPIMTLGAVIAFRTADRLARAGASYTHTLDAAYSAVRRYLDVLPISLQDRADQIALDELLGAPCAVSTRVRGSQRGVGPGVPTGAIGSPAA